MTPTREQFLQWAEEVGIPLQPRWTAGCLPTLIEALCQRVWNEAIESAANECISITWSGRRELSIIKNDTADECAEAIRKLKVTP